MPNGDTLVICGNVASGPPPEKRITLASLVAPRLVSRFCTAKQCRINSLDFQDCAKTLCFSLKSNTVYFPACAAGPAGRQHQRRGVRVAGPRVPAQKDGRTGAMQCASLLLAPPSPTCASMCRNALHLSDCIRPSPASLSLSAAMHLQGGLHTAHGAGHGVRLRVYWREGRECGRRCRRGRLGAGAPNHVKSLASVSSSVHAQFA